jgi:hypothetical protein
VVHDPGLPPFTRGTGERLQLTWWVAVPLEGSDGAPAALWGSVDAAAAVPFPPTP